MNWASRVPSICNIDINVWKPIYKPILFTVLTGIARELKDAAGEACALLNLGNCLSSRGEFSQAVPYYEQHLMLSQELGDVIAEAKACHFLGYAHYCLGNYKEAVRYKLILLFGEL